MRPSADSEEKVMEMKNLVSIPAGDNDFEKGDRPSSGNNKPKANEFLRPLMLSIDEHMSCKRLIRLWKPRFELVVRFMLVATFFDDSFGTATQFSKHSRQIMDQGCFQGLAEVTSLKFTSIITNVVLFIGLLAQFFGSICLVARIYPDAATKAVIVWAILQPILYSQLSNYEFVAESLSLIGGLIMLRAHLLGGGGGDNISNISSSAAPSYPHIIITHLIGRLLLPAMYMYYAGNYLYSVITLDETSNLAMYISSLSMFVLNTIVLLALVFGSALVATGLKSRLVALSLGIINLCFVVYQHPFFRYIWRENGQWHVDEDNMPMPSGIAVPKDVSAFDFDTWQIYDLHRYYFFLGFSVSGALLLLAQMGPGDIAVEKDEVLLPDVNRAQD